MRARILALVTMAMLVPASQAAAQPAGTVAKGSRVRLESASVTPHKLSGTVVELDETTLKLRTDSGSSVVVPRGAISKLDVMVSRGSNWKAGALIGAAVGFLTDSGSPSKCSGSLGCIGPDPNDAAAAGVVVLAGVGALIGSLIWKETWAPVESSPRFTVAATRKGGVVSLSFPF